MQIGSYNVHSPMIMDGDMSEAEVFGAAVWLWIHSAQHRDLPLHALPTVLLSTIKPQPCALVSRDARPLFSLSGKWLDDITERRYLKQLAISVQDRDRDSGVHMWIRDWIALLSGSMLIRCRVCSTFFTNVTFGGFTTAVLSKASGLSIPQVTISVISRSAPGVLTIHSQFLFPNPRMLMCGRDWNNHKSLRQQADTLQA